MIVKRRPSHLTQAAIPTLSSSISNIRYVHESDIVKSTSTFEMGLGGHVHIVLFHWLGILSSGYAIIVHDQAIKAWPVSHVSACEQV